MARTGLVIILLLCNGLLIAQERRESVDTAVVEYFRTVNNYSPLYYGIEYEGYPRSTNHPFLKNELYTKARLSYNNIIYPEVSLRLDLYRNELVVQSPGLRNIVLYPENVDFAELHGKHIIYFHKDSLPGCPSSGYYFLLYAGKCVVMEKRNALLVDKLSRNYANPGALERYFDFSTMYYLYKDGRYYPIKNKKGLLKTLQPYEKELKRFVSSRKLNFKNNPDEFINLTINEYEKLSSLR